MKTGCLKWRNLIRGEWGVFDSPRFELSEVDFGWGKERKIENLIIDREKYSMSMCNARKSEGVEFGLSFPKERMEAFLLPYLLTV